MVKDADIVFQGINSTTRADRQGNGLTYTALNDNKGISNYFKTLFEKCDTDNNGIVDPKELAAMLKDENKVSDKLITKMFSYSDTNKDGKIDVDEFIALMLDKKFKTLFRKYITNYVDFIVPPDKRHRYRPTGSDADEVDGGVISKTSLCPPPLCMIFISLIEIVCYILNQQLSEQDPSPTSPRLRRPDSEGVVARYIIYDPYKRQECWRFLTYMMVHIGWEHLATNLLVQLFLGLPLEFRNQWWRVLTVYSAGIVAGSLVTSITDPKVYLAGASGGVYAVLAAHLANLILNWHDMKHAAVQLIVILLVVLADLSSAIYNRYIVKSTIPVAYAAHLGGALAGLLVGIWILKNIKPTRKENYLWWAAFIVYILLMGTAVLLNVFWPGHFLPSR